MVFLRGGGNPLIIKELQAYADYFTGLLLKS